MTSSLPLSSPPPPCWSSIVKTKPSPNPIQTQPDIINYSSSNSKGGGIAIAVVDANVIIQGGEELYKCADKFVSVSEVIDEIRDPVSRRRVDFLGVELECKVPDDEAMKKVIKFARATGDIQTLSDVDIKLIALTYTLEAQIHGTEHLRDTPPPIQMVHAKRMSEKEMPGWGNNVPNLAEWEALENAVEVVSNKNSKILALTDLNTVPMNDYVNSRGVITNDVEALLKDKVDVQTPADAKVDVQARVEDKVEFDASLRRPKKYLPVKKEINIEGKILASGIDASQGQADGADDWLPAVSRSTHRRFLRRKARREMSEVSLEINDHHNVEEHEKFEEPHDEGENPGVNVLPKDKDSADAELSSILNDLKLETDSLIDVEDNSYNTCDEVEGDDVEAYDDEIDTSEFGSQAGDTADASINDDSSEQSWMIRSMSESSVACVTGDFAMQNVLLQIGLRLVAPGGMQIRELHRWILRCHACNKVTAETERIFCPKCGNGGTLRKVAVTVNENGVVLAARKPRIILRGTKYSIPLPRGGRDAVTKNVILREDQVSRKELYPNSKKKLNKQGDDFFVSDDIFNRSNKKAPLKPPVRQALAIFSGKRNPNDNHYSRSMH